MRSLSIPRLSRGECQIPYLLGLTAFIYYSLLSSKSFTWIFVSGDSGDWLAASTWWMVPQPAGSPLYILLGQFLNLFPGDLVIKMTILLSCLPAAATVALVCAIARKMTGRIGIGALCALVTMGATILLTQATVLEEYAMAVMFVTLAYWLYLGGRKRLMWVSLGLGTAIHAFVLPIALLWLVVERKAWREHIKPMALYAGVVAGFYSMVPIVMATNAPPLLAGYFGWGSLWEYISGTSGAVVGTGSIFEFPRRMVVASGMLLVSLGLAVVPAVHAMGKPISRPVWVLLATCLFALWFHVTSLDPVSWTFMSFMVPPLAILAGLGLAKLGRTHMKAVAASCAVLILANGLFMNAGALAREDPQAEEVLAAYESLPQGSAVLVYQGDHSLALYYAMARGRDDIVPMVAFAKEGGRWGDYESWLLNEYGIGGDSTAEMVGAAFDQGRNTYIAGLEWHYEATGSKVWEDLTDGFSWRELGNGWLREVTGCTGH